MIARCVIIEQMFRRETERDLENVMSRWKWTNENVEGWSKDLLSLYSQSRYVLSTLCCRVD
jgi:hypothetical protein